MQKTSYVQLFRSESTYELMKEPAAFMLLTIIALRAQRTTQFNSANLKIGQAFVGDHKSIGLSRQQYRAALKKLEKWKFITTKATNRGTIVTLCNDEVYNINEEFGEPADNHQPTIKQPSGNHQATTTNNVNNKKKDKNENRHYFKSKTSTNRFRIEQRPDYTKGL